MTSSKLKSHHVRAAAEPSGPVPVIFDGDMGGDDAWAIMMLLAHPDKFRVLGISSVFGNVDLDKSTKNACDLLAFTGYPYIRVYPGSRSPLSGANMLGDNAYGEDGLGGVDLGASGVSFQRKHAVEWMGSALERSKGKVTLFVTGPMTNIARVLRDAPHVAGKIERIVAMGGGVAPGPNPDVPGRAGNITEHAEFNFFQDPYAVNVVAESGVRVDLVTMDANHNLDFTASRREKILSIHPDSFGQKVARMLDVVAELDMDKFGLRGPAVHDPNVIVYALHPGLYTGKRGAISVEHGTDAPDVPFHQQRHGKLHFKEDKKGNVNLITGIKDPDRVFSLMLASMKRTGDRVASLTKQMSAPEVKP